MFMGLGRSNTKVQWTSFTQCLIIPLRGRSAILTTFVTGQKHETIRARALERGTAGFLLKPFSDAAPLAAIKSALQAS